MINWLQMPEQSQHIAHHSLGTETFPPLGIPVKELMMWVSVVPELTKHLWGEGVSREISSFITPKQQAGL